jgi:hypothetical protein
MTDVDNRPATMAAGINDISALAKEMADEGIESNILAALRCSLNVSLRYAQMFRTELNEGNF